MPSRVGTRTPPSEVGEAGRLFSRSAFLAEISFIQTVNTVCPSRWRDEAGPLPGTRGGLCFLSLRGGLSRDTSAFQSLQFPLSCLSKPARLGVSSFHSSSAYQSSP